MNKHKLKALSFHNKLHLFSKYLRVITITVEKNPKTYARVFVRFKRLVNVLTKDEVDSFKFILGDDDGKR